MRNTIAFFTIFFLLFLSACKTQDHLHSIPDNATGSSEDFYIVDCLLPGQLRKLGQSMTYLTARRPVKTSASDCEIRGGEYVAYDRANYSTALKIWLPKAKEGDAEAQAYVGEIYEKGLGLQPDYHIARKWYLESAEQGNTRAQINLGFMYEKGLGVEKDIQKAMEWYRQSSGLSDTNISYAYTVKTQSETELSNDIQLIKGELKNNLKISKDLSAELDKTKQDLLNSLQNKKDVQSSLEKTLAELETATAQQNAAQINSLKAYAKQLQANINRYSMQHLQLEKEYNELVKKLERNLIETEKRAKQIVLILKKEEALTVASSSQQTVNSVTKAEKSIEPLLQETPTEKPEQTIQNIENLIAFQDSTVKPMIEIIDPAFVLVRGIPSVALNPSVKYKTVSGKVTSSSRLLSLSVNDEEIMVNDKGVFQSKILLNKARVPVKVVAIDRKVGKSDVSFVLTQDRDKPSAVVNEGLVSTNNNNIPWNSLDFGKYYALIIANNTYQKIPSLITPVNDAQAIDRVLKAKYGFETTVLLNATRYEILSKLNELRKKLTEKDNLLIYYAGHGELDRVNMRGHWLPVDADPDNSANWISTISISDILNTMSTKHIMVVSDSCYSGAMTRSSIARLEAGISDNKKMQWITAMIKSRSRTVLTSGGLQPVLDSGGGEHSIFANAFINTLDNNNTLLEAQSLYYEVSEDIVSKSANYGVEQIPEYAPIRHAGHESGEFFFVPVI